ncbi:MAG: hypothetical protein OEY52_05095 [Gammaproteobacteria bacterium]|nr:hypothetical protein [Gammaproteobacteria bacterium]
MSEMTTRLGEKCRPAQWVEPEKAPLGVTRHLFGATKPRSSCLDWRFFWLNSGENEASTDPNSLYFQFKNQVLS